MMGSAMQNDIRYLVREILAEELKALKGAGGASGAYADTAPKPQVREESVEIASSRDLQRFALRMLDLAKDSRAAAEIRNGRWRFHLSASAPGTAGRATASGSDSAPSQAVNFEKGLVSERQIAALPEGALVEAGPRVRFTPLALDEINRRGIRLKRRKA
jgi:hypothetical protein